MLKNVGYCLKEQNRKSRYQILLNDLKMLLWCPLTPFWPLMSFLLLLRGTSKHSIFRFLLFNWKQMALTPRVVEEWINANVLVDKDHYTPKEDIWQSLCATVPNVSTDTKGEFFAIFGRVIQKMDNVFVVKRNSKNVGYQGVFLKNELNVAQFKLNVDQLNKNTVKDWATFKLAPGTSKDTMTKEKVWNCYN